MIIVKEYWAVPYVSKGKKVKSPLRYPGGKFYALKHIMPYIECIEHDEYREPFMGGGSVFFAKEKAKYNILNDLESDIVNFYNIILNNDAKCELINRLVNETANKDRHNEIKNFEPKNDLDRAFKTYYLNRTSYCGIINTPAWGYAEGKSSPPENWGAFIENASEKLKGSELFSLDYEEILHMPPKGKSVLIYLDPPYYHADQKRAYTKPFSLEEHTRLANNLMNCQYKFCLSYDDCYEVRALYKWANIYDVSWLYNTDNISGKKRRVCKELIITNYPVKHI